MFTRYAMKDVKLLSSKDLMGTPVLKALNKYFDQVIEDKNILKLSQTNLFIECCRAIFDSCYIEIG